MATILKEFEQGLKGLNTLCGADWLSRSSLRWARGDWGHPMVSAYHFAIEASKQGDKAILQSEHALKVLFWHRNISTVLNLIDLDRFQKRIRQARDCEKALYEVQLATDYCRLGYRVEFGDTGQYGHDLKVSNDAGSVYAECKKKGETERDKQATRVWQQLQAAITTAMTDMGRYAYVFVESSRDPVEDDVMCIGSLVRNLLRGSSDTDVREVDYWVKIEHIRPAHSTERGSFLGVSFPSAVSDRNESLNVNCGPSSKPSVGPRWPRTPQHVVFECKSRKVEPGLMEARNVMAIGFRTLEERDYVKTVVSSLVEVRKRRQLPPSGPGIIHIEIGAPSGGTTVEQRFDEIAAAIRPELLGAQNRRVNAVVLTCTGKIPVSTAYGGQKMSLPGIATLTKLVRHDNPRCPFPIRFRLAERTLFTWGPT